MTQLPLFKTRILAFLATFLLAGTASAGITYRLEETHAVSGEAVDVTAVIFHDADTVMDGTAPKNRVLQRRDHSGHSVRSVAYLQVNRSALNIPVNNFVKVSWS